MSWYVLGNAQALHKRFFDFESAEMNAPRLQNG
jgi:hypothetical protein